jgi:ketosteroid isomerase-like protein
MATKTETIKAIYNAFATGNIPFILETVSENFTWLDPSNPAIVPYGGLYKGRSGFLEFFQKLGGGSDLTLWQVDDYISGENNVVATGKHGFRVKTTGKEALTEWAMIWTFENDSIIAGRAYYNNTASEHAFA